MQGAKDGHGTGKRLGSRGKPRRARRVCAVNVCLPLLLFTGVGIVSSVRGNDIHVAPGGQGIPPYDTDTKALSSVGQAVAASAPGDRILVSSGVYAESVSVPHTLTLVGEGMHRTVIDGQGAGRCITAAEGVRLTVSDLTVRQGQAEQGGGVWSYGGSLELERVRFQSCTAGRGGALYAKLSSLSCLESVFERCVADIALDANGGKGGAVYLISSPADSTAEFTLCRFAGNRGVYGGAVRFWTGRAVLRQCHFLDNRSEYDVIEANEVSSVTLVDCLVISNQSRSAGTVSYLNASYGRLSYCTVSGNVSLAGYPVLYADVYSSVQLWNSVFQANDGDDLEVPFGTLARGCVFSTPPSRLSGLAAVEGPFYAGPDGGFYLGQTDAQPSPYIGAGDPDCPDTVAAAERKVYALGSGISAETNAGYGYPVGTTATLSSDSSPAVALSACGLPLLDYMLEVSETVAFDSLVESYFIGPLGSVPRTVLESAAGQGTRFYRVRGLVPSGNVATVTVRSPAGDVLAGERVDIVTADTGQWVGSGWTDDAGVAQTANLSEGEFTALAGVGNIQYVPRFLGNTSALAAADSFQLGGADATFEGTVTLGEGAAFRVTVRSGLVGLAGARVTVYTLDQSVYKSTLTGSDGVAIIGGLAPGTYRVSAAKPPEYGSVYWSNASTFEQAANVAVRGTETKNLGLNLVRYGRFTGTVYAPDATPAIGVFVVAYDSTTLTEQTFTLTDDDGNYELFAPADAYILSAGEGSGYVIQYSDEWAVNAGGSLESVDFYLVEGGVITGNIHLPDGTPAGDLYVDFYIRSGSDMVWVADAYVDSLGDYLSPVLEPGTYYIQVYGDLTYTNSWYTGTGGTDPVGVPVGAGQTVQQIDISVTRQ